MSEKTEAQRLADELDDSATFEMELSFLPAELRSAAAELRRLDAEVLALRGAVPDGCRLAPLNPTPEMKKAGGIACGFGQDIAHHTYVAMLAVAPQPAAQPTKAIAKIIGHGKDYRPCQHDTGGWRDEDGVCVEFSDGYRDCFYVSDLHVAQGEKQ
jgi:hypothetical protein